MVVGNVESGAEIANLVAHENTSFGVAVAPKEKRLATASFDRTIKVWEYGET